ncbi:PKD domain-containing protein [Pedobacter cryotolerans]|uniref:PKD domain-containing protein n=1 Tax=Pedobacter cryotolerans TaxID=2571270 RepID=A0A4U1CG83_9SPHI|nr:PKD domain-containing protein [Pedobacter cryotolerans]TKC03381.1 PKD domain-containing protein [Pedobacter cryotolerans]
MRNICLLFIGILFGFVFSAQAQLNTVVVDPGPYTPGSTIAATFNIDPNSCIRTGNRFDLVLVSPLGVELSVIGSYTGFYTSFVNGIIPDNTPIGTGYKLRIKSTSPVLVSTDSAPFEIRAGTAIKAEISSGPVLSEFMFGFCPGRNNFSFSFTNQSTATSTVTGTIKNELSGSIVGNLNFTTTIQSFNAALAHYTVSIKAVMPDGSIATRAYMVVNNNVFNNFSTSGTNVVCLPGGFLEYGVDVSSQTGIQNNYPGNTYQISWGDGITETYTFCDLKTGSVKHEYLTSSCGNPPYSTGPSIIYNVFGINISVSGPCGQVGGTISTYAKVVTKPENRFTGPPLGCVGQPVTFINTSIAGQDPSANTPECADNDVTYNWYVDGVIQLSGVRKSVNFVFSFPTKGNHIIKLESVTNGVCEGAPVTQQICIQEPPKPAFDITTATTGCAPFLVKIADKSILDNSCTQAPPPTYNWIVTNANNVRFTNFINNVPNPEIQFTDPGVYSIVLEISSGACGVVRSAAGTPIIIINGQPTISLAPDTKLCRLGSYLFDNIPGTPTQTIFTGTQVDLADTYTWTVTDINGNALTSADYTFDPGSDQNSKHPSINFKRNIPYQITVTHKNTCASVTKSQIIEFVQAPIINLGADQNICFTQASVNLQATVTGNVLSGRWEGGSGTYSTPNNTTTTYTPTAAERASGLVTLKYTVTTDLQQPCTTVSAEIKIFIKPEIKITSSATKTICTGIALNYAPTANIASTSFTWTATGTANASGFNNQATPSIFITDILTNSDPINNATVTYIITPINDGCNGVPFTLVVTVAPKPILTATLANSVICSGQLSGITLTPNLAGTTYTWISTATGGVTGNSQNGTARNVNAINDPLINNGTGQGIVTYTITPTSINGCEGAPVTVTITVEPALTIPNAGLDDEICIVSSYTLKGNPILTGSGLWTEVTTFGATFVDATSPTTQVDNLIAGNTYIFRWTVTGASACDPISDEVSITRNQPSVGGTTSSNIPVVCGGTNSGIITLVDYIGTIIRWESSTDGTNWTPINNTTTTLTFTNINTATSYRAVVQSGACAIANSAVTIINVNSATVVATAGTDQTLCNQTSTQLEGKNPGTNSGLWTVESGQTVNFADATLYNTQVNGLVGGEIYTFRWTITGLAPCPPTSDDVIIFNSAELQNNSISTPITTACTNQIIALTGSTPTGGNGVFAYVWESSSDGTNWTVINGQINKDLNVTVAGSLSYRRTVNSGSCTSVSDIIVITALPPVGNNTIADNQVICANVNPVLIVGSQPNGGDGNNYSYAWEQSTDGTTWVFVPGADGKDFQPPLLTQTTNYRRLVSSAACSGSLQSISNSVKITVNQNARAEYTYLNNVGCAPFLIDDTNVKAVPYPAQNTTYTWYANGVEIGNTITFPGYTIATDNQTVEIKLVTTSVLGCSNAEVAYIFSTRQSITAAFTQDKTEGCGPLEVIFTNTSTQLTGASFKWDFGNGTTSNLTQPGAIQFLADPAGEDKIYTVTLEVTTPCGTNAFPSTVTVKPNPISIFSPNRTSGCSPFVVQFSNTSPGNNNTFTYDFGDGTPTVTTNNKNSVTHTFTTTTVQDFVVKMTASNACGTSESQYTIRVAPNTITPELVVNANQLRGCAPLSVDFFNNTIGASFYRYTFGDGSVITSNNSQSEKQTHIFTRPGVYTVELFATNGCSEATTTETITVLAQPLVSFIAETTTGCIGLAVKFKNLSQDGVSYLWDFGDGTTSTAFEPTHTYQGPANTYTVSLTAVNALGCPKTFAIPNYIRIVPPPRADFNIDPASIISIPLYTFKFTDASTNGAQTYKWTFGDGAESTLKDPTHLYADTGKYLVTMRTFNEFGCVDSLQKTVQIVGVPGYVYLPNSFIPGGTSSPLQKFTAVGSGIKSWRMQIFNKWAQVVWETTQLDDGKPVEGWDGTYKGVPQPQGIYFWKLEVELINGTEWKGMTYDNKAPKRTGEIYLIR